MLKKRLDLLLVERGYLPSREQARRVIRAGHVFVNEQKIDKPGRQFADTVAVRISSQPRYVSRGGEKLKGALDAFSLKVADRIVLDAGSSTGGFTDCLLQEGARRVYCLDVGKGQLAWKLRQDPRVVVREGCNVRYLTGKDLPEAPDLITIDVSFISLRKVIPACADLLPPGGVILALIKPQFEAGRAEVKRGGVVHDSSVHRRVVEEVKDFARRRGLFVEGVSESVLTGPAGNREFFILLRSAGVK